MDTNASLREELNEARETIRLLREIINPCEHARYHGLCLSKNDRAILQALIRTKRPLDHRHLRAAMDVEHGHYDADPISVDVALSRLRPKLAGLDPPVTIINRRGDGWCLDDAGRELLAARRVEYAVHMRDDVPR
jgi:DNA-binding response OmpR family regulator